MMLNKIAVMMHYKLTDFRELISSLDLKGYNLISKYLIIFKFPKSNQMLDVTFPPT